MSQRIFSGLYCCCLLFTCSMLNAQSARRPFVLTSAATINSFPIFSPGRIPAFYYDANDAAVVGISATAFVDDVHLLSGKKMQLKTSQLLADDYAIVAGTIGHSTIVDGLIAAKKLHVENLEGKW